MSNQNRQKDLLAPFTPPGMSGVRQLKITFWMAMCTIVLLTITLFGIRYQMSLGDCYVIYNGRKRLQTGMYIAPFRSLIRHYIWGVVIYVCYLLTLAEACYRSFYQPNKSIYVMKRIRNAGEMHRRCLTVPLMGLVLGLLLLAVTVAGCGLYYQLATPAEVRPVIDLAHLWRVLI